MVRNEGFRDMDEHGELSLFFKYIENYWISFGDLLKYLLTRSWLRFISNVASAWKTRRFERQKYAAGKQNTMIFQRHW